jgi:hypothetical protein
MSHPINPTDSFWHHQFLLLQQEHARLQQEHTRILNQLSTALQSITNQGEELRILKDEIARLKRTPTRPKLPPGNLEGSGGGGGGNKGNSKPGRGRHPRKNKRGLTFHNQERLRPKNIPHGAIFKGTRKYDVQNIICQAYNTRYIIERWQLPDGTYIEGELPAHVQGHYGVGLRAHVLNLAYSCRVPEDLMLDQLHRYKIAISAGQLQTMLTEKHDDYHAEKAEILKAALESGQIQTDDVGTRHRSKNCYTNVICNEFFVHLTTTNSKSRINFLKILAQGRNEYRFNQDAYDYLGVHQGMEHLIQSLMVRNDLVINTEDPEKAFLNEFGHLTATEVRLMTEAGLFASLIEHGVPRDLNVHSDDAGQFEVFKQSLCWIHEERHYRKLIPTHPEMATEVERVRGDIWQLYKDLKSYKEAPSAQERVRLFQLFDSLFNPEKPTLYQVLNDRLALTYAKRDRLLFVLDHPTTPLHNNLSETGGRGAKVKSKISGGTRSDKGRKAWDTFGSLNLTCRRLGICFYKYLMDRFLDLKQISRLGDTIRERAKTAFNPAPMTTEAMKMVFNTS